MRKRIKLNSYHELIDYLQKDHVTMEQVKKIVEKSFKMFFTGEYEDKATMIEDFRRHYEPYNKPNQEKPLFIDKALINNHK